jgi:hypothetical protein
MKYIMTKHLTSVVASWMKAYPQQDPYKLYLWAVKKYEQQHRGDVVNEIPVSKFIHYSNNGR